VYANRVGKADGSGVVPRRRTTVKGDMGRGGEIQRSYKKGSQHETRTTERTAIEGEERGGVEQEGKKKGKRMRCIPCIILPSPFPSRTIKSCPPLVVERVGATWRPERSETRFGSLEGCYTGV
jgi:hypothetical protein